jgi:uncharacterized DUF497 family protein
MDIDFEWDDRKASENLKKHGISFDIAKTVFLDPLAYIFEDKWHSQEEPREIIIGHNEQNQLILVSFTERSPNLIRIISARLVTSKERRDYEEYTGF